ncbi:MAG: PIG-L family deacetylase [Candidatus Woesearchaeota archaeon]
MRKGQVRALAGATLNSLLLRPIRHRFWSGYTTPLRTHVLITHPDDELAFYKTIREMAANPAVSSSFTLLTNGTQGYEPDIHGPSRKEFAHKRENELFKSLLYAGHIFTDQALVDERAVYEALIDSDPKKGFDLAQKITKHLQTILKTKQPDVLFVNDFGCGNVTHDINNYLACRTVEMLSAPTNVIEYWQGFLHAPTSDATLENRRAYEILGDLSYDEQGRKLRDQTPGKYDVMLEQLGIRKGRAFNGILDIARTLHVLKTVYTSQKKSMTRLQTQSKISYGLDTPRFRSVNISERDFTHRPWHGVQYEHTEHRLRGLERLPNFEDYKRFVHSCDTFLFKR